MSTLVIIGLIIVGLCGADYFRNRSIVKCIECGGDVPHFAKACPHCGTRKYRKKIIGMTMYFLTLCFGFPFLYYWWWCSCTTDGDGNPINYSQKIEV